MDTLQVWNKVHSELYFFILKTTKDKEVTQDVFQNTFYKVHRNIARLKNSKSVRAWVFQIARNEITNYYNQESIYVKSIEDKEKIDSSSYEDICCFDKFIDELPKSYQEIIELIYIKGLKQREVAQQLNMSLANEKIRVSRAKDMLKKRFNECCQYEIDKNEQLVGESNCSSCD